MNIGLFLHNNNGWLFWWRVFVILMTCFWNLVQQSILWHPNGCYTSYQWEKIWLPGPNMCTCNHVVTRTGLGQFRAFTNIAFVYSSLIWFQHNILEFDIPFSVIVALFVTVYHSPRASPLGCDELSMSSMRPYWPQHWYHLLRQADSPSYVPSCSIINIWLVTCLWIITAMLRYFLCNYANI